MKYRKLHGYKYELMEQVRVAVKGLPRIRHRYIAICVDINPDNDNCLLAIHRGYAWDGASGPTFDDKTNMRASLVHDALYQLMREKLLSRSYRKYADELLRDMIIEDAFVILNKAQRKKKDTWLNREIFKRKRALVKFRAWYYYQAVRIFGAKTSLPEKHPRGEIIEV
jgi:hypothetical protein